MFIVKVRLFDMVSSKRKFEEYDGTEYDTECELLKKLMRETY